MRDQILALATEQLMAGGYDNLSFADIAKELSTTRANIHHHFKNKEGLAIEATELYIEDFFSMLKKMAISKKGNFKGFLKEFEKMMISMIELKGAEGACVCSQLIRDESIPYPLQKVAGSHFVHVQDFFAELIAEAQESGEITTEDSPHKLAILLQATLLGVGQMALVQGKDPKFVKSLKGILVNRFF